MNTPVEAHSEPQAPICLVDQRIGKYRLVRKLGEGGMGSVFEAVHAEIGQRAAVKLLKPELSSEAKHVKRFFDEAKLLSMVSNPGLIKIYDFDRTDDGQVYIVMELLEGETLWSRFEKAQTSGAQVGLPVEYVARLVKQVASALAAVHERGILHRDLKPDNIFIVKDSEAVTGERAKILDFGIARLQDPSGEGRHTTAGVAIGTPTYMSPEQCEANPNITDRVDVYSLGIMSYELLTGAPPFKSESLASVLRMHLTRDPPPLPPSIPEPLAALVMQMLAKEAKERPSMTEVTQRIDALFRGGNTSPAVRGLPPRAAGRRAMLIAAVSAGALLAAGGTALLLAGRKRSTAVQGATPSGAAPVTSPVPAPPPPPRKEPAASPAAPPDKSAAVAAPEPAAPAVEKKRGKGASKPAKPREPKANEDAVVFGTKKTKKGLP